MCSKQRYLSVAVELLFFCCGVIYAMKGVPGVGKEEIQYNKLKLGEPFESFMQMPLKEQVDFLKTKMPKGKVVEGQVLFTMKEGVLLAELKSMLAQKQEELAGMERKQAKRTAMLDDIRKTTPNFESLPLEQQIKLLEPFTKPGWVYNDKEMMVEAKELIEKIKQTEKTVDQAPGEEKAIREPGAVETETKNDVDKLTPKDIKTSPYDDKTPEELYNAHLKGVLVMTSDEFKALTPDQQKTVIDESITNNKDPKIKLELRVAASAYLEKTQPSMIRKIAGAMVTPLGTLLPKEENPDEVLTRQKEKIEEKSKKLGEVERDLGELSDVSLKLGGIASVDSPETQRKVLDEVREKLNRKLDAEPEGRKASLAKLINDNEKFGELNVLRAVAVDLQKDRDAKRSDVKYEIAKGLPAYHAAVISKVKNQVKQGKEVSEETRQQLETAEAAHQEAISLRDKGDFFKAVDRTANAVRALAANAKNDGLISTADLTTHDQNKIYRQQVANKIKQQQQRTLKSAVGVVRAVSPGRGN